MKKKNFLIFIISSSSPAVMAVCSPDQPSSNNYTISATGGDTCYANLPRYTGGITAHVHSGGTFFFTEPDVEIVGQRANAYALVIAGIGTQSVDGEATVNAKNLTVNSASNAIVFLGDGTQLGSAIKVRIGIPWELSSIYEIPCVPHTLAIS